MWNKLRARHYSVLILLVIVTLETSAIAIDRFLAGGEDFAFSVESDFRNNSLINRFQAADANSPKIPNDITPFLAAPHEVQAQPVAAGNAGGKITLAGRKVIDQAVARLPEGVGASLERWIDYSVKKGDSLAAIAQLFGQKSDSLRQANGLEGNGAIKAGQTLRVPMNAGRLVYPVREGDSLSKIASRFGVTLKELLETNNLKSYHLVEDQKLIIPVRSRTRTMELVRTETPVAPVLRNLALIPNPVPASAQTPGQTPAAKFSPLLVAAAPSPADTSVLLPLMGKKGVAGTRNTALPAYLPLKKGEILPFNAATPGLTRSAVKPLSAVTTGALAMTSAPSPVTKFNVTAGPSVAVAATQAKAALDEDTKLVAYKVQKGDHLSAIAQRFKTSVNRILACNPSAKSSLKAGQEIQVPVNRRFYRVLQVSSRRADVSTRMFLPVRGKLNDGYGWRYHPIWKKRLFHAGIDLTAPSGSPIYAAQSGTVVYAGWRSGYGKLVVVRHANGLSTRYGHCSSIKVKNGQSVKGGQVIARVGATGVATGPHLHFETVRNGKTVNPSILLYGR